MFNSGDSYLLLDGNTKIEYLGICKHIMIYMRGNSFGVGRYKNVFSVLDVGPRFHIMTPSFRHIEFTVTSHSVGHFIDQ